MSSPKPLLHVIPDLIGDPVEKNNRQTGFPLISGNDESQSLEISITKRYRTSDFTTRS